MTELPADEPIEPTGSDIKANGALPQRSHNTESCATHVDAGAVSDATPPNDAIVHIEETSTVVVTFPDGDVTQGEHPSGDASAIIDTVVMTGDVVTDGTMDDPSRSALDYDIEALLFEAGWENRGGDNGTQKSKIVGPDRRNSNIPDVKAKTSSIKGKPPPSQAQSNVARTTGPLVSSPKVAKGPTAAQNVQVQGNATKKSVK